jgi:hypothetical protein
MVEEIVRTRTTGQVLVHHAARVMGVRPSAKNDGRGDEAVIQAGKPDAKAIIERASELLELGKRVTPVAPPPRKPQRLVLPCCPAFERPVEELVERRDVVRRRSAFNGDPRPLRLAHVRACAAREPRGPDVVESTAEIEDMGETRQDSGPWDAGNLPLACKEWVRPDQRAQPRPRSQVADNGRDVLVRDPAGRQQSADAPAFAVRGLNREPITTGVPPADHRQDQESSRGGLVQPARVLIPAERTDALEPGC